MERSVLVLIVVLKVIVLLGQLRPEGAPAFARWVNIFFLVGTLGYFVIELKIRRPQVK